MTRRRGPRHVVALVGVLGALATGCGVPADDEPSALAPAAAGLDVGRATPPSTSPPEAAVTVFLSLVRDERLVQVTRDVVEGTPVAGVVSVLLDGPTPEERRAGLRTAIPVGTVLGSVRVDGDVAHVDVSEGFAAVGGEEEILAVAQIVRTVTSGAEVRRVAFELEGEPIDVPTAGGTLHRVVTAEGYAALVAP